MLKFVAPIAAAIALVSSPALASPKAPSIKVEYKDLDLSTESGRESLDRRIKAAAKSLCPTAAPTGSHIPRKSDCYDNAMKSVRDQLAAKGVGITTASR